MRTTLALLLVALFSNTTTAAPPESARRELADVADQVAALFDQHRFVFITSTHGDAKVHEFLLCLLSRPAFQERVTDIVVEFATAAHQDRMDRYLLKLESIPPESLRAAWFDTDDPKLWAGLPQMGEFMNAVRKVNDGLDARKRIRVLGGNEPIPWASIRTTEDVARYPYKTNWTAHLLTEHLAPEQNSRVLVVYGEGHIHHDGGTLMSDLESELDAKNWFVIGTIHDLEAGESERVRVLGDPRAPYFVKAQDYPAETQLPSSFFYVKDGALSRYVDGVLYLGPEPDRDLSNTVPLTKAETLELARRESLRGDPNSFMMKRLGKKNEWFKTHPHDVPERP